MAGRPTRIGTLALVRELWSDAATAAPAAATTAVAYGDADDAVEEVRVFLGEALKSARPPQLFRHLLPPGARLVTRAVPLVRSELPHKLRTPIAIAITAIVVPDVTDAIGEGAAVRGHWVFVPTLGHTFYAAKDEELEERLAGEVARVVDAAALDPPAWRRLLPAAAMELVAIEVDIAGRSTGETSRRALIAAERRKRAEDTLDAIGTRVRPRTEDERLPLVGRAREELALAALLDGRDRLSVLIVGEEGTGKSALLRGWADQQERRPLWQTSTAQLIAGASGLGEWQERVAAVLDAAEHLDAVLYLDDFGTLFADRPEQGGFHVASLLRRWVTGNRARVIGELTAAQLDRGERREVALLGAMTRVRVEPLDPRQTIEVGVAQVRAWARGDRTRPIIDPAAVPSVVELARRYLPYRAFPGKVVRFLDELRAVHDGEREPDGTPRRLGVEQVYDGFSLVTGIPAFLLRDDRALLVDQVIARFRRRLIGQDEAVRRVAETICVVKAQLQPADKPLATFLFVGPTGVGKTELAKSLAHLLFGAEDRMVRFDMSEYTDPWAAERLIRGAAGGGEGLLTAKVREQPFCVLLLDEIEKAHPSVFDLLLQVIGEGRLTDARGRTTYFQNAIIIMTSNLGTRGARAALGIAPGDAAARDRAAELERYRSAVATAFRPEFVGRIDRVIAFHRLGADEVAEVARLAIARLGDRRGFAHAGVALDVSPEACATLAAGGHSLEYGVRALRRHIEQHLIAPAARLLAAVGVDGHGGVLAVRTPDEADPPPAGVPSGARLGAVETDALSIRLYRRTAASGKRALRGALAVCDLRRWTDREMASAYAIAVRDQIAWLESQLATAIAPRTPRGKKKDKKEALSAPQIQAMHVELARLSGAWEAADGLRGELRAAEELVLHALAAGEDADEIAGSATAQRRAFRGAYFWLVVSRLERRDQIALVAHGPDHAAGLVAWTRAILDACALRGWTVEAHLRTSEQGGAPYRPGASWGPPRGPDALRDRLEQAPDQTRSVLLRVRGNGCALLLGLEAGLHRFHGKATVDPCHVTVEAAASFVDFSDAVWASPLLAANRPTSPPRVTAARAHPPRADHVTIDGQEYLEVAFATYAARLEEIALTTIEHRVADGDLADLWKFTSDGAGE